MLSNFDEHEGDQEWFDQGDRLYEQMLNELTEDFGSNVIDQHAADLMYDGWFNADTTSAERAEIWWDFFDYTGIEWDDFDWEAWREWYA